MNKKIYLIENHKEAYFLWKKFNFKNKILIHFDAHHDCLIDYFTLKDEKYINDGNFIFSALNNGIIKKVYWIIPGINKEIIQKFLKINQLLYNLKSIDYYSDNKIFYSNGVWKTQLFKKEFLITTIDKIPTIKEKVLIDIDLDFFFFKNIFKTDPTYNIKKRNQWLSLKTFKKYFDKKKYNFDFLTISYSVNDGWTPMKYKYIGNLLAKKLGLKNQENEKKIIAGKYFLKFRNFFDKGNIKEAKKYYKFALLINPYYFSFDNNYGKLYLLKKEIKNAKNEFLKMLKVDNNYYFSNIGLGLCFLKEKKYQKAFFEFKKALILNPKNFLANFFISFTKLFLDKKFLKNNRINIKNNKDYIKNNDCFIFLNKLLKLDKINKKKIFYQKIFDYYLIEKILND